MRRNQAKQVLLLLLLVCLISVNSPLFQRSLGQPTGLKILVDNGHSNLLAGFTGLNQTAQKFNASLQYVTSLQALTTPGARLLIVMNPQANYTSADLSALEAFLSGGGTVWIAGGGLDTSSTPYINRLLAGLNSDMRLEQVYLEDPLQNRNSTQQDRLDVTLPIINHDYSSATAYNMTRNVRTIFAYKPVPIIGWAGNYTAFQLVSSFESRWLASSSPSSRPSPSNPAAPLFIRNQNASQEIIARESLGGGELLAFGSPVFTDLMDMSQYNSTLPADNAAFISNLLGIHLRANTYVASEPYITEKTSIKTPKVVVAVGHSLAHNNASQIATFSNLLGAYGFQTDTSYVLITSAFLSGAEGLVIASPATELTTLEVTAIKDWLSQGHRFVWIASSGDDPYGDSNASSSSNLILKDLNSTLRFEQGTVFDNSENLQGQPFLALSSILNRESGLAANYTQNVRSLYFSSPTNIVGWMNSNATRLEDHLAEFPTVTWLARTSNNTTIETLTPSHKLLAYNGTGPSSLILAATETESTSTYLLTGAPLFIDYQGTLRYPTLYGYPADNNLFLRNVLLQILQRYVNLTTLGGQASRPSEIEGSPLTIHIQYRVQFLNLQTMDVSRFDPVPNPTVDLTIAGTQIPVSALPNGTYVGTAKLNATGSIAYNITTSANGYANQTSTGQINVLPAPGRFALYVLAIPVVIFIATTVVVIAKKTK